MSPGAIKLRSQGQKKMPAHTIHEPITESIKKQEKNKEPALDIPCLSKLSEKTGIKDIFIIPSEKSFLARSKGRKAIKKASL